MLRHKLHVPLGLYQLGRLPLVDSDTGVLPLTCMFPS